MKLLSGLVSAGQNMNARTLFIIERKISDKQLGSNIGSKIRRKLVGKKAERKKTLNSIQNFFFNQIEY